MNLSTTFIMLLTLHTGFASFSQTDLCRIDSGILTIDTTGFGEGVRMIWVEVTDTNGCSGRDTIKINFTPNPGIAEWTNSPSLSVVPNPASDQAEVFVNGHPDGEATVKVFSTDGRLVTQWVADVAEGRISLDVARLPAGHYLLRISSAQFSAACRLIIQR